MLGGQWRESLSCNPTERNAWLSVARIIMSSPRVSSFLKCHHLLRVHFQAIGRGVANLKRSYTHVLLLDVTLDCA